MGWLHAGFGIGSALGPAMITGLLAIEAGWRIGFWVIAGLQAAVVVALAFTLRDWDGPTGPTDARPGPTRPVVRRTLLVFMFYVGLEVAAAQWGFTLLVEGSASERERRRLVCDRLLGGPDRGAGPAGHRRRPHATESGGRVSERWRR